MSKYFYSHLVTTDSLMLALDSLELSDDEREHLKKLIDSTLHQAIVDAILSELSEEDKVAFLTHLAHENEEKTWELLQEKVDKIEDKIKKAADDLTAEIHKDIEETRQEEE
jgi:hypothetical protein